MTVQERLSRRLAEMIPGATLREYSLEHAGKALRALLIEEESGSRPLPAERVQPVMEAPPFWSLLWPSGERMVSLLLTHPDLVRGKTLLDLGCGCGLVACAAALADPASVTAVDCDELSRLSTRVNAQLNGVTFAVDRWWRAGPCQVALLADLLYDETHLELLEQVADQAEEVLVVDSRLRELTREGFRHLGQACGVAVPDLDPHREFGVLNAWYRGPETALWAAALGRVGFR